MFETATADATAALHHYPAIRVVNAIDCARAMVRFERGQRPIGIRQHVDAALGSDQNGEVPRIGGCPSCTPGCFQNRSRILEKSAHDQLIGTVGVIF